jgi:hypothetical protein
MLPNNIAAPLSPFDLPTYYLNRNQSYVDIFDPVSENWTNPAGLVTPIIWNTLANGAGYTAGQLTNNSTQGLANVSILNAWGSLGYTDGLTNNFQDSSTTFTASMVGQSLDIETVGSYTITGVTNQTTCTLSSIPPAGMNQYWSTSVYGFDKQPCVVSSTDPSGQTIFYSILAGFPFSNPQLARKLIIDTRNSTTLPVSQRFLLNVSGLIDVKQSL